MSDELSTHQLEVGYKTKGRSTSLLAAPLNVTLHPGELTCLIGPNGAGKSTLMRTLAGMQPPLAGYVTLGNARLDEIPPQQLARQLAIVLTERVDVGNLSSYALAAGGQPVSVDQMQPGDVVTQYSDASHVGIYIGDGLMVHASTYGIPVRVESVHSAPIYNVRRY